MAKKCIICGKPAGSAEHLFPASFGGRRTDTGIYCAVHNKAFGRHVDVLLDALGFINSRLGVVPDGQKEVRPSIAISHSGELYQLANQDLVLAPPPNLSQTPELHGKLTELPFSGQSQASKWRRRQEKARFVITQSSVSEVRTTYFTRPPRVSITLVEKPFQRAAAYIALTYLAHYHPDIARMPGIACIKEVVANEGPLGSRVWWEALSALSQLAPNQYEWGHTIAISLNAESNEITAIVSFFGEFVCGVLLGRVRHLESSLTVTHIDPLARSRPDDIKVIKQHLAGGLKHDRVAGAAYFTSLGTGQIENPFLKVKRLMDLKQDGELAATLLPQLVALSNRSFEERTASVLELLRPHGQRFMNSLSTCVSYFVPRTDDDAVKMLLAQCIEDDPNTPTGLTPVGQELLDGLIELAAKYLDQLIHLGRLNQTNLAALLGGQDLQTLTYRYLSTLRDSWLVNSQRDRSSGTL